MPAPRPWRALEHVGRENIMRRELRDAVTGLFRGLEAPVFDLDDDLRERLSNLATFTARARSAVVRDGYKRDVDLIPGSERPARLVLALARLLHGMRAIGTTPEESWRLITRVALDCLPEIRRRVFQYFYPDKRDSTTSVALAIDYPTTTARRACEDLAAHGILTRYSQGQGRSDQWELSQFCKDLVAAPGTFPEV
jgi:hypothetical protein